MVKRLHLLSKLRLKNLLAKHNIELKYSENKKILISKVQSNLGEKCNSNFKNVEGRNIPFEMETNTTYMGQVYKTPIKILSIEVNKEMSDDLFKKPEIKN